MRRAMMILPLLSLATLGACQKAPPGAAASGSQPTAIIAGHLTLPAVPGHPAAAYFTLHNGDAAPITLTGVTIAGAANAEMHETKGNEMVPLDKAEVPPGADLSFAPGGRHVMVFGLPASVKPGDNPGISLVLGGGRHVDGTLKAEAPGGAPAMGGAMDHEHMKM